MPHRPRSDLPRLSGRPDDAPPAQGRETPTVFRRFFDLLERFDRPHDGPARNPHAKSTKSGSFPPQSRGGCK